VVIGWLLVLGLALAAQEPEIDDEAATEAATEPASAPSGADAAPAEPADGGSVDAAGASSTEPAEPDGSDSPDAPAEPTDGGRGPSSADIVVYGERKLDPERRKLEQRLLDRGYDRIVEKDGYAIFRHDESWKGEFRVYDDGWVRFKRQPVQFRPTRDTALGWVGCALVLPCLKTSGQTISQRKFKGVRRRQTEATDDLSRTWGDRVADRTVDRVIDGLPDRLEALWDEGVPLDANDDPLPTPESRKAALLAFWESRTDTVWGNRVRAGVEIFIRAEVQTSPWPFTAAEIAAFNQRRTSEAALDLDRPYDAVLDQLEATEAR